MTPLDTFAFGSGTKPYTAVLIAKLASEGKLELERPAAHYVDGLLDRLRLDLLRPYRALPSFTIIDYDLHAFTMIFI